MQPRYRSLFLALLPVLFLWPALARSQAYYFENIATTGVQAPGGGTYGGFFRGAPGINNLGNVAFTAWASGVKTYAGIFTGDAPGSGKLLAYDGQTCPGGGVYKSFNRNPKINDLNVVIFNAGHTVSGVDSYVGHFVAGPGGSLVVMGLGNPAPGGGTFTGSGDTASLNNSGLAVFQAAANNGGVATLGIYSRVGSGPVKIVARNGDPAPGGGNNAVFNTTASLAPWVNSGGTALFYADVANGTYQRGLFTADANGVKVVVSDGQAAPGGGTFDKFGAGSLFPDGDFIRSLNNGTSVINDAGTVAFFATIKGANGGLFLKDAGGLKLIARLGDAAPGGSKYYALAGPALNSDGTVAFYADLAADASSSALFVRKPDGTFSRVVSVGDTLFGSVVKTLAFNTGLNDSGQIAFHYTLGNGTSGIARASINGKPLLTSLSPNAVTAGSAAFTLTANGSGFVAGSKVQWNGKNLTTTFVSAAKLTASVPASAVAKGATISVTVANPGGQTSTALPLTVTNPAPVLTALSPSSAPAFSGGLTLTATGTGFVSGGKVTWNGKALTTKFVNGTTLTAVVPASLLTAPGTASVKVANPLPGGGTSGEQKFTILPAPFIGAQIAGKTRLSMGGKPTIFLFTVLSNVGFASATNVTLTSATLNGTATSSTLPLALGTLDQSDSGAVLLTFAGSSAVKGVSIPLVLSGTYDGGAFTLTLKVTAP